MKVYASQPISVYIDGNPVSFDVQPENVNGRVMVPFRAIGEAIGAKVQWDADNKMVWMYLGGQYIGLTIGEKTIKIGKLDGPEIKIDLDVPPIIENSRTLVPVRAVSEGLRCDVKWQGDTNTVQITTKVSPPAVVDSKMKLLAAIEENIDEQNKEFVIDTSGLPDDVVKLSVTDYFLNVDHWDAKYTTYEANGESNCYIEYKLVYSMYYNVGQAIKTGNTDNLTDEEMAVYERVGEVIADIIKPDMTDYDKELAVHDYLVYNTAFDERPADRVPLESHTPYGALIDHLAVCNGYSDSFKIFMDALGIECDIVYGDADVNGVSEKHAWNRVKLDGDYYLVDVTWDDPPSSYVDYISYDYFNLTDESMDVDHHPYSTAKLCTASKYNYYVHNNLLVESQDDADRIINDALNAGMEKIFMRGVNYDVSKVSFVAFSKFFAGDGKINYVVNPHFNTLMIMLERPQ